MTKFHKILIESIRLRERTSFGQAFVRKYISTYVCTYGRTDRGTCKTYCHGRCHGGGIKCVFLLLLSIDMSHFQKKNVQISVRGFLYFV